MGRSEAVVRHNCPGIPSEEGDPVSAVRNSEVTVRSGDVECE
jgi:hypothetical protein